jgi:GTPase Era involved in 16S rRNA processing
MISTEEISQAGFNENHERRIRSTFQYIDDLLNDAERAMASAGSPSLFNKYADDTTPLQRKITHDYINRIRAAMSQLIVDYAIPVDPPRTGARWSAQTALLFAEISVSELRPEKVQGYGPLPEKAAQALEVMCAQLHGLLNRLQKYLAQSASGDLETRLRSLDNTRDEVALLHELERIVTAHGLVELRGTLTMIVERAEKTSFEIGIFGRVSSGKSSLLNHLLERDFLPVGVTPVTAIPTRVRHGAQSRATISFAENQPLTIGLERLAEFSSEQQNPSNTKHVTRIDVELDAPRLREGVTFVDTPGIGSLALAGAEETVAYLPQCDLGLVLIDAGSSLTYEDLTVLEALYRSGATAMALISKADLLDGNSRRQIVEYAREHLQRDAGIEPPVHLISVIGTDAALCDQWFERELRPLLDAHKQQAAAALRRKIGALRESIMRTLENRLRMAGDGAQAIAAVSTDTDQALRRGEQMLNAAYLEGMNLTRELDKLPERIIEISAEKIADVLANGGEAQPAEILSQIATQAVADAVGALLQKLARLREQLVASLRLTSSDEEEFPEPGGVPAFDPSSIGASLALGEYSLLRTFGKTLLTHRVRSQIREQTSAALVGATRLYSKRILLWLREILGKMSESFTGRADIYRSENAPTMGDSFNGERQVLEEDVRTLREWELQHTQ